jgi:hypothetical protein
MFGEYLHNINNNSILFGLVPNFLLIRFIVEVNVILIINNFGLSSVNINR